MISDLKLKESQEVNFHFRCGFVHDSTGTLCIDAGRYMDNMCNNSNSLFPRSLISKKYRQPLETNDHPELDVLVFCNESNIDIYQLMIGSMEWAISISKADI